LSGRQLAPRLCEVSPIPLNVAGHGVSMDTFARQLALGQIGAGFCGLSLRAQPRPLFLQLHDLHLKILHPVLQRVGPLSQCRNLPGMGRLNRLQRPVEGFRNGLATRVIIRAIIRIITMTITGRSRVGRQERHRDRH
jgi:hypothetical protein